VLVAVCCSILFVVCVVLIGGCSAAMLRIRGAGPFVMAAGVCASAALIAGTTVLSIFSAWTRTAMLVLLVAAAVAAVAGWFATGRARPTGQPALRWLRDLRGPTAWIVALAAIAILVQGYIGFAIAPSNWDSMTYHLSRAAYWLQYDSIAQYPGATLRQAASGPDGEVLQALTMMMSGTDRWVASVQWLALIGTAIAVFSGARLLRFDRGPSAFAACLFVLLPQPLMQSTTTQNDLIETFFVGATAFFMVRGLRDRSYGDMAIAALAVAMAIGTKGTAFVAASALAVLAVAALIAYRPPRRFAVLSAALAVPALFALATYNYVLNVQDRGSLFGGLQDATQVTAARFPNALAVLSTFADSPGLGITWLMKSFEWVSGEFNGVVASSLGPFAIDVSVQEDTSAFGLIGFLVLPCVLLVTLARREETRSRRVLAGAVLFFILAFAATFAFNVWLGRLLIPAVALAAPLFAVLVKRPAIAGATVVLAFLSFVPSLLENSQKPILVGSTAPSIFHYDRRTQMTVIRPELIGVLNALDARIDKSAPIAFVGNEDSWDYPFFGEHRDRRIVRYDKPAEITYAQLRRDDLSGAVFANVGKPPRPLRATSLGPDYWWVPARR
jgi:hypothetical protein